jgi:broad specificity phosphatase PhoE
MLQAVAAAQLLGSFDAIFASSLQRAADTAAIISESSGVGPVQLMDDLQEIAFGPWQGLTINEIEDGWPGYLAAYRRPEGAEQADAVVTRGLRALHTIAAQQPRQQALVITHAGLLRTVRRALIPADLASDDPALPRFGNLGGCWFHVYADGAVTVGETVNLIDLQANRANEGDSL